MSCHPRNRLQVLDGTDPAELRDELREALPRSPKDQKVSRETSEAVTV